MSRKRCDNNAEALEKLDLTTELEKHRVRTFFKKCIHRLKEEDRALPQVTIYVIQVYTLYSYANDITVLSSEIIYYTVVLVILIE